MEQPGSTERARYPFAEVEERWRKESAGGAAKEPTGPLEGAAGDGATASDGAAAWARHYLFVWPAALAEGIDASRGVEQGGETEATLSRRWIVADTLARFLRHRSLNPFMPAAMSSFAPALTHAARTASISYERAARNERERLGVLARAFGAGFTGPLADTSEPACYRFGQWLFLQLVHRGIAHRVTTRWDVCSRCGKRYRFGSRAACPACQGDLAARESFEWQVDISGYGERLIGDLERSGLDEGECAAERGLLGRCRGCEVSYPVARIFSEEYFELTAFTTSVERIFGVTFLLVDPYHPILEHILDPAYEDDVVRYRERLKKGAEPRISAARTGGFALNPANLRRIPILVSPLARAPFSDGVVMAVPAHDADLFELARRQKLPIREVIHGDKAKFDSQSRLEEPWLGDGTLTNSGPFTSMTSKAGRDKIIALLSRKGVCRRATRFQLSKLPLASSSPWGPPVPIVHCKRCGAVPVPESQLPVELPAGLAETTPGAAIEVAPRDVASKEPASESGLAAFKSFVRVPCPQCGEGALRDTQTLLPWVHDAWSFIPLALPDCAGAVEGFRDLSLPVAAAPPAIPAAAASRLDAKADALDDYDAVLPAEIGMLPASKAPFESAAPKAREAQPEPGSADDDDVLPEDVDIFSVSTSDVAAGAADKPLEDGARGAGDLDSVADADAAGDESESSQEGDASARSDAEPASAASSPPSSSGQETGSSGRETGRDAPPATAGDAPKSPAPESAEDAPEPEEEEEDSEAAGLARLSKLRPFLGPPLDALFPIGSALGPGRVGSKDLIAIRFLTKFLCDAGQIPFSEPFARFRRVAPVAPAAAPAGSAPVSPSAVPSAGASTAPPVSCLDLVERFGSDALRLHLLFTAPLGRNAAVDSWGVRRMQRFLDRIWRQMNLRREKGKFVSRKMLVSKHFLIHDVTRRLSEWKFHTAVASLMSFVRFLESPEAAPEDMDRVAMRTFVILLSPFAPFLAQELWSRMGESQDLRAASWPVASDELIHPPEREFLIYVDGKLRDRMQQPSTLEPEKLESRALGRDRVREIVGTRKVERVVVVPQKLVSVVLAP